MIGLLRKTLIVLFLLMAGTVVLYAQGSTVRISGSVKDEKGEILSYATIRLKDTSLGCITDSKGNFSFNGPVLEIKSYRTGESVKLDLSKLTPEMFLIVCPLLPGFLLDLLGL